MVNPTFRGTVLCLLVLTFSTLLIGGAIHASEPGSNPASETTESTNSSNSTNLADSTDSTDLVACSDATLNAEAGTDGREESEYGTNEQPVEDVDGGPVCHGILTCTFYVTGQVIKLPFRLLGGVLDIVI